MMLGNLKHIGKSSVALLSLGLALLTSIANAQELDLSGARAVGTQGTAGSSGSRRDKGMPLSIEMEALIVDLMSQNIDGDFCTIYKDKGVQVSDGSVRTWLDTVKFSAPGIVE